ncbi:MAG TPA: L-threonylcarbamoyladenylate synthase [Propionibacteriaceae bacterium]|nr:L-threonylcarbamoyladenylate synthase [Propionibacteriaceae bacterium]
MADDELTDPMTQSVPDAREAIAGTTADEPAPGAVADEPASEPVADEPAPDEAEAPAEEAGAEVEPPRRPYRRFDLLTEPDAAIEAAREAVAAGECIVLPTDTVYGIGANAFSADAVQRLLDAKGRGRDMPPPVLISEPGMLDALGVNVSTFARRLADKFWPGALTLVVEMQSSLRIDLGETGGTIALRVPDHDAARSLLRRTGPLAVSSANASGHPSATTVDEAIEQLGDSVSVYLDAGPTPGPVASTIVEFVSDPAGVVLREGVISFETISDVAPLVTNAVPRHAVEEQSGDTTGTEPDETPEAGGADGVPEDGADGTARHAESGAGPVTEDVAEG